MQFLISKKSYKLERKFIRKIKNNFCLKKLSRFERVILKTF